MESTQPKAFPAPLQDFAWATFGRPETCEELGQKWRQQRAASSFLLDKPRIALRVKAEGEASREAWRRTLTSLQVQSYPHWEALVVGAPKESRLSDPRFIWADDEGTVDGDWVGLVSAGDVLSPVALYLMVLEARKASADVLYTHEAELTKEGARIERFLSKSRFSWFNLIHFDAVGRFWLARRQLWKNLNGLESAGRHAEHDFLLRAEETGARFCLLPLFLYYRAKQNAAPSADTILSECVAGHLDRKGFAADVELTASPRPMIKVRPHLPSRKPLVSAIICFKDKAEWTIRAVQSLCRRAGGVNLEIFLVDNQSNESEARKVRDYLPHVPYPVEIVEYRASFNFAEMHNRVARDHARGQFLLCLNNDVFWEKGDLKELVAWASLAWVGTVGICLRYGHGGIQHAGLRAFFGGPSRLARLGHAQAEDELAFQNREVFGNTFAACLFRRELFDANGGLRAFDLPNGFGDVAFNFDCVRNGLRNLYLGHLEGVHLESASRGTGYEYWEEMIIEREYPEILQRMLREDAGYNRVPAAELSVPDFAKDWLTVKVREKMPWLKPLKVELKKRLREASLKGDKSFASYEPVHRKSES